MSRGIEVGIRSGIEKGIEREIEKGIQRKIVEASLLCSTMTSELL